jgi:hypothetical protein
MDMADAMTMAAVMASTTPLEGADGGMIIAIAALPGDEATMISHLPTTSGLTLTQIYLKIISRFTAGRSLLEALRECFTPQFRNLTN